MIPSFKEDLPYLTTEQMIEVDRAMVDDYGIHLIQMMENAGHSLANLARHLFFGGNVHQEKVCILAGSGGNGGGALVAARRLHNYGAQVQIFLTKPEGQLAPVTTRQLVIIERMKLIAPTTLIWSLMESSATACVAPPRERLQSS